MHISYTSAHKDWTVANNRQIARSANDWVVWVVVCVAVVASRKRRARHRVDDYKFLGDTDCAFRIATQGVEVFQADQVGEVRQTL